MDRTPAIFRTIFRICLITAPILAAVMSLTSDYNRHPDEIHHFEAARYYVNHFLPPEIGDPSVRSSYSVWGVSYLNYHWIEYFLAGKFIVLASPFIGNEPLAARFFNILLFAGLAAFFTYRSKGDTDVLIIPALLLITPQVWYVFSYVNNDAFPLAVSFLLAFQAGHPESSLSRYLDPDDSSGRARAGIGVGLLLGLLLISKSNYYAFLIFLALWMLYKFPVLEINGGRPAFNIGRSRKYALIFLVSISVLVFRCGLDLYVNGETNFVGVSYINYVLGDFEKKENRLLAYQEEIAEPAFKPSMIERDLGSTHPGFRLKDKGTSYSDLFFKLRWHEITFKSFVGVYGYMNIFAADAYYRLMALLYAAICVYLIGMIVVRRRRDELARTIVVLTGAGISIFISSYLSWSYAFQAQGRYLLPVLPMVGVFLYGVRNMPGKGVLKGFVLVCFLLSAYSFVFVGISRVNSPPVSDAPVETSENSPGSVNGR